MMTRFDPDEDLYPLSAYDAASGEGAADPRAMQRGVVPVWLTQRRQRAARVRVARRGRIPRRFLVRGR